MFLKAEFKSLHYTFHLKFLQVKDFLLKFKEYDLKSPLKVKGEKQKKNQHSNAAPAEAKAADAADAVPGSTLQSSALT